MRSIIPGLTEPLMDPQMAAAEQCMREAAHVFAASTTLAKVVPSLCSPRTACATDPNFKWASDGRIFDDAVCVMWRTRSSDLAAVTHGMTV